MIIFLILKKNPKSLSEIYFRIRLSWFRRSVFNTFACRVHHQNIARDCPRPGPRPCAFPRAGRARLHLWRFRLACGQGERKWPLLPKPLLMLSRGNSPVSQPPENTEQTAPAGLRDGSLCFAAGRASSRVPPRSGKRVSTSQASAAVLPTSGLAVQQWGLVTVPCPLRAVQ